MAQQTQINGNRYGFTNVFVQLNGADMAKGVFKSIDYGSEQTSGEVYGNQVSMVGKTEGTGKGTCSFEMLLSDSDDFDSQLTNGGAVTIMSVDFTIQVQFSVNDVDVRTDRLEGCRIQKVDQTNQQGSDAAMAKYEILATRVYKNGIQVFGDPLVQ